VKGKIIVVLLFASFLPVKSFSASTRYWEVGTREDFSKCKVTNVSLHSRGEARISPEVQVLSDTGEASIWAIAEAKDGSLYLGTGNNGKIFKFDRKSKKLSTFYDSPEIEILCLAVDKSGNLYAGTSPDGLIYRISPEGNATTFFMTGEKYVWSLVFGDDGTLYAGTGDKGKIYAIGAEGKGRVLYDSPETHIMALLWHEGYLYASGEGEGIIYRIKPGEKPDVFALYDSPLEEVRALALDKDGNIYAAASSRRTGGPPQPSAPGAPRSSIFIIPRDGAVKEIWSISGETIFSIAVMDDGNIIAGSGAKNIYMIDRKGEHSLLAQVPAAQVICMMYEKGEVIAGTGNTGKLVLLSGGLAKEGIIESIPYDAGIWSRWGRIFWDAHLPDGTGLFFSTRSGNTSKPDDTWSPWTDEESGSEDGIQVKSPPARFIQWRCKMVTQDRSTTPILRSVVVSYLPKNRPPEVGQLSITTMEVPPRVPGPVTPSQQAGAPGAAQPPAAPAPTAPTMMKKSVRMIRWMAGDPDGDQMRFSVYIKGVKEANWRLLKDELTTNFYTVDTNSIPDGIYLIKVVATDKPSNPPLFAMEGEAISDPFPIDNTPPSVSIAVNPLKNGKWLVTARAEDVTSRIREASYSVDGKDWVLVFPMDGVFDSKVERFSFELEFPSDGEHTIVLRAVDMLDNIGSGSITFSSAE